MADSIIPSAPLSSYSELRYKWFCEIPIDGFLASSGELIGARSLDHVSTPLESIDELDVKLERGFNCKCPIFQSDGSLLGNKYPEFEGVFETIDVILGSVGLDLLSTPLESNAELLGEFIRDIIIPGILETTGQLICSQLPFITSNLNYFILSDGALLTVAGDIGCFEISAFPITIPLEAKASLLGDLEIVGGVYISWGDLESTGELSAQLILEVVEQGILESQDSLSYDFLASRGLTWIAIPLLSTDYLLGSVIINNLPSGDIFHTTDIISLTKPLDLIKLNPGRVICR